MIFSQLDDSWLKLLETFIDSIDAKQLSQFLQTEQDQNKIILPEPKLWFNALNQTLPEQVKVVILGQDPYPTLGHAHGLSFSVLPDVKPLPKSLLNIFKELQSDLAINNSIGYLQSWAEQGVLLLNSVLTVEAGHANSHQGKGWELFTDEIIRNLNDREQPIVFVLWGKYAQKKGQLIQAKQHLIIESPHPSPLSAYRGFFGSQPFSKINDFLQAQQQSTINWQIDPS